MEPGEANPVEGLTLTLSAEAARLEAYRRFRENLTSIALVFFILGIGSSRGHPSTASWQDFLASAAFWSAVLVGVPLLLWFFRALPYFRNLEVRLDEMSLNVGVPGEMRRLILTEVWLVGEAADGLVLTGGTWSDFRIPRRLDQFEALRSALRERVTRVEWPEYRGRRAWRIAGYLAFSVYLLWMLPRGSHWGLSGVVLLVALLALIWTRPDTGMVVRLGATAAISIGICVLATVSVVGLARIVEIVRDEDDHQLFPGSGEVTGAQVAGALVLELQLEPEDNLTSWRPGGRISARSSQSTDASGTRCAWGLRSTLQTQSEGVDFLVAELHLLVRRADS